MLAGGRSWVLPSRREALRCAPHPPLSGASCQKRKCGGERGAGQVGRCDLPKAFSVPEQKHIIEDKFTWYLDWWRHWQCPACPLLWDQGQFSPGAGPGVQSHSFPYKQAGGNTSRRFFSDPHPINGTSDPDPGLFRIRILSNERVIFFAFFVKKCPS